MIKIITLIENLSYGDNLLAEHGLSLYIESNGKKILFDTGQSGAFVKNAERLGVDISLIDDLVISHGHYDHTGGLYDFIKNNRKAKIHIKKEAFIDKYRTNKKDFIGIPFSKSLFADRLSFVEKKTEIMENIFIMPEINIYNKDDLHYDGLLVKEKEGFAPDTFRDEQFLVMVNNNALSIISGCSHNGITNIVATAKDFFKLPVKSIIGGFHLKSGSKSKVDIITGYIKKENPSMIGVSHCTGVDKFVCLKNELGDKVFYNHTGKIIEI